METNKPKTQRNNYKKKYELAQGSIKNLENICDQYLSEIKSKDKTIKDIHTQNIALKNELSQANHRFSSKDTEIESLKDTIANLGDKIRKYETLGVYRIVIILLYILSLILTLVIL